MTVNPQEIAAAFYDAFNAHDMEGMEVHLAPEVQWPTVGGAVERGRAAFKAYWQGAWAKDGIRIEPLQMETVGGQVHVRVQQVVTSPAGAILENRKLEHIFSFDGAFISGIEAIDRDPNPDEDEEDDE